jgi:hypothetical protein
MKPNDKRKLALMIAILLDAFDFILGWIPIAGDVLDAVGLVVLLVLVGPTALISLGEFIPFVDFLPLHTVGVLLSKKKGAKE